MKNETKNIIAIFSFSQKMAVQIDENSQYLFTHLKNTKNGRYSRKLHDILLLHIKQINNKKTEMSTSQV